MTVHLFAIETAFTSQFIQSYMLLCILLKSFANFISIKIERFLWYISLIYAQNIITLLKKCLCNIYISQLHSAADYWIWFAVYFPLNVRHSSIYWLFKYKNSTDLVLTPNIVVPQLIFKERTRKIHLFAIQRAIPSQFTHLYILLHILLILYKYKS